MALFASDQGSGIAPQIAQTQQIQSDFAPQGAFVSEPVGAAVTRAEPDRFVSRPGDVCAVKRGAAHAGFGFGAGEDDLQGFHSGTFLLSAIAVVLSR